MSRYNGYIPTSAETKRRHAEEDARKRLIAAAPDLLAACKEAYRMLDGTHSADARRWSKEQLAAAVSQAEGSDQWLSTTWDRAAKASPASPDAPPAASEADAAFHAITGE